MSREPLDVHNHISGQTKNAAAHHFCRTPFLVLRAQCALTALRHSSRLSAAHVAVQAEFAAGVSPATPFLYLRPDEKCCFTTFLPDSVPCSPCAMRTHRTCVTAVACPPHMSPYKRDLPQGSPLHPVFESPARRKMLFHNIFAGLRSLCSVRKAHSPHRVIFCP